ncbi:hypothetical protein Q427_24830 [Halomonas sp. BC04]|nr:hypothetical protein Q427_24830 [Halomonas sp. BC04]
MIGDGQVNAIIHMVSSSVPELAAEDVTVVDQGGRLLSMPGANRRGLDATQLDYIAEVERSFQQRIENILAPILGQQNVRAQVAARSTSHAGRRPMSASPPTSRPTRRRYAAASPAPLIVAATTWPWASPAP